MAKCLECLSVQVSKCPSTAQVPGVPDYSIALRVPLVFDCPSSLHVQVPRGPEFFECSSALDAL